MLAAFSFTSVPPEARYHNGLMIADQYCGNLPRYQAMVKHSLFVQETISCLYTNTMTGEQL